MNVGISQEGWAGRRLRRVAWTGLVALVGCAGAGEGRRGSDGLLDSLLLQAVVDAGIERDAAALSSYLDHPDPSVRARAAFQLASMPGAVPRSRLAGLLDDEDARVRADAAFALGRVADTLGTSDLVRRLRDEPDGSARAEMIEAVGNTGGRGAAALLLRTDVRDSEMASLALALSRLGHRGVNNALAVERLFELTGSTDPQVRQNAAYYFGRSDNPAFWAPVAPRLRERIDGLAKDDMAAAWLLLAIGQLGDPVDADRIVSWLGAGADWRIRYAAASSLRPRVDDGAIRTVLFGALSDPSPHVRTVAADAVSAASSWSDEEVEFVRVWIGEHPEDWRPGGLLLRGLARFAQGGRADVEAWLERTADEPHPYASGLRALDVLPDAWARSTLIEASRGTGPAAAAALETLAARLPTERTAEDVALYFDPAADAARSGDPMKVNLAATILAYPHFRDSGSVGVLEEAFRAMDDAGRAASVTTLLYVLGDSGEAGLEDFFRPLLEHASGPVRAAAAGALSALTGESASVQAGDPPDRTIDWDRVSAIGPRPRIALDTDVGEIVLELDTEQAPLTVQSFVALVEEGAFDGTPFHRVVPFFVIQGGDTERGDGYGDAGFRLRTEATRVPYRAGTIGMASAGPDTESSQFFLTQVITPHLDGAYSAFGRVMSGQDVVDRIERWHVVRSARRLGDADDRNQIM